MRIKYLQIVTDEDLVVCEQVDGDEEIMMLVEERNILDDDEIENEVTELEFEKDKGMNDGTIEENLPGTAEASISDTVVKFLPLEKVKSSVWWFLGFPAHSGECKEKEKRHHKEVFCTVCKNPLNYMGVLLILLCTCKTVT